jgi:hypothetical protein
MLRTVISHYEPAPIRQAKKLNRWVNQSKREQPPNQRWWVSWSRTGFPNAKGERLLER